jgi:hypothetical protein
VAQSMAATCHIYIGLKLCCWPESTPRPPGRGKRLGKGRQPARHCLVLVIYMEIYLYMFAYVDSWGATGLGLSPSPWSHIALTYDPLLYRLARARLHFDLVSTVIQMTRHLSFNHWLVETGAYVCTCARSYGSYDLALDG